MQILWSWWLAIGIMISAAMSHCNCMYLVHIDNYIAMSYRFNVIYAQGGSYHQRCIERLLKGTYLKIGLVSKCSYLLDAAVCMMEHANRTGIKQSGE